MTRGDDRRKMRICRDLFVFFFLFPLHLLSFFFGAECCQLEGRGGEEEFGVGSLSVGELGMVLGSAA